MEEISVQFTNTMLWKWPQLIMVAAVLATDVQWGEVIVIMITNASLASNVFKETLMKVFLAFTWQVTIVDGIIAMIQL